MVEPFVVSETNMSGEDTTADFAYARLREMIIGLELPPGSTIREQALQDRLGIGRTPLREALHRLAQEHMLHIYPRRAIVVAKLGVTEIRQIFEMRVIVESAAAGLVAERIGRHELQHLMDLAQGLTTSRSHADVATYLTADHHFHRLLGRYAQNAFLEESIDRLQVLNLWLWHMYFDSHHAHSSDLFAHEPIIDAIAHRDRDAAIEAMRSHVLSSKEQLLSGL